MFNDITMMSPNIVSMISHSFPVYVVKIGRVFLNNPANKQTVKQTEWKHNLLGEGSQWHKRQVFLGIFIGFSKHTNTEQSSTTYRLKKNILKTENIKYNCVSYITVNNARITSNQSEPERNNASSRNHTNIISLASHETHTVHW